MKKSGTWTETRYRIHLFYFSVNFGCFIKVDGPEHDYQESQNEGEYVRVYGCYRQKNRLYNQRFAFTRQYYGAGDETHSNFDERRSKFNADVEIVYDGMTWVMRRSGGGPPLAWTPPTSAFQPPHGGWITEDGIVGITISRKSPPGKRDIFSIFNTEKSQLGVANVESERTVGR